MGAAWASRAGPARDRGRRRVGTCTGGRRAGAGGWWGAGGERRGADTGMSELGSWERRCEKKNILEIFLFYSFGLQQLICASKASA
jgi:hypothetical protein